MNIVEANDTGYRFAVSLRIFQVLELRGAVVKWRVIVCVMSGA